MTETTLGQRIAQRRKMLGISQEAFGEKMGVSRQAISKWEADAAIPEVEKLIAMSKLFGVSVGWLLGTETCAPADEKDDLSAKIMMTFQPPQPEPEKPPAPEPAPAVSEPAPEEKPAVKWLPFVCAIIAGLSLILSIFSLTKAGQSSASPDARIGELEERVAELEEQIAELDAYADKLALLNHQVSADLSDVQIELESALTRIDVLMSNSDTSSSTETNQSTYDSLSDWSLTCTANSDLSKVTLELHASTTVETTAARLVAQRDGEEIVGADCSLNSQGYYAQLEVPADDNYQYLLLLTHRDGTVERLLLDGHGLSDLTALTSPRVSAIEWDTNYNTTTCTDRFYMGWKNLYLNIPELAPQDGQYQWSDLRISYYHNDELVSEEILADSPTILKDADLTKKAQSLQIPIFTFQMSRFCNGDTHELRLEGTLTIDGQPSKFSVPLTGWIIENAKMVQMES